jgi:hypothetical protein
MSERFVDDLQRELAEERAGALGRCGRRLEDALELFHDHEAAESRSGAKRERLLWDLAERVEAFVVQREACGLRDSRQVLKLYGIPAEVIARVGARRPNT